MRHAACLLAMTLALLTLSACASNEDTGPKAENTGGRVSPAPIPPATVPPGTFNQAEGESLLAQSYSALQAGRFASARSTAQQSLAVWPGDARTWDMLLKSCQGLADEECAKRALFFRDKVLFVEPLSPRTAMLGFQNLAASGESSRLDRQTLEMARLLEAFYNLQDPDIAQRDQQNPEPFLDRHPYAPMAAAIGVGAVGAAFWALSSSD